MLKPKKDDDNQDDYRRISLFNSMNKVFDYIITNMCKNKLTASDMQFAQLYRKSLNNTMYITTERSSKSLYS